MSIVAYTRLAVVGAIFGGAGIMHIDKTNNYVETEAKVISVSTDCYVENSKSKLVEKDTNKTAYMDCEMAEVIAPMKGYATSDIRKRTALRYTYQTPVDGDYLEGGHTDDHAVKDYSEGDTVKIFVHKTKKGKTWL